MLTRLALTIRGGVRSRQGPNSHGGPAAKAEATIWSFLKDSLVYALGIVLSRLAGFVMIPVYTRVLTPSDYGVIETISRLVDAFGLALSLGLAGSLLRHYHTAKDDGDRRTLVSSTMILMTVVTTVGIAALMPTTPLLTRLTFGDLPYDTFVRIALVGTLLNSFISLPLTIFQAAGRAWRFTLLSVLHLLTALILNILLVVYLRLGVMGVMLSGLLTATIWGSVLTVYVMRSVGIRFRHEWARKLLVYGTPLVPALLAQFTLHFSDRFFLVRYVSADELGLYSLGYRFAMLVAVFYSILDYAWWPWAFRVANAPGADRKLVDGAAVLLVTSAAFCSAVILLSTPIIRILAAQPFWDAARYVAPLALAYWFFTSQAPFSLGSRLAKRTDMFAAANIAAALMCLTLSLWLIPRYGTWGGVVVTLASFAFLAGAVLYCSHLVRPLNHRWSVVLVSLLALLSSALFNDSLTSSTPIIDLLIRASLWLGITACLLFCVFLPSLPLRRRAVSPKRDPVATRALLIGYYGAKNLGDDMMLHYLLQWMREQHIHVTVASEDPTLTQEQFGIPAVRNVPLLGEWSWFDSWFRGRAPRLLRAILDHDSLVVGGGDLLRDDAGWRTFWYTMEKIALAILLRKPVYLVNIGIGRPRTMYGRLALQWTLPRCRRIIVRDRRSLQVCRELGCDGHLEWAPDIVLRRPDPIASAAVHAEPYVLVSLRDDPNVHGRFRFGEDHARGLAAALDYLVERHNLRVRFRPFQSIPEFDDNRTHHQVREHMMHPHRATIHAWTNDLHAVASEVRNATLAVAMPLHAAVLAVANDTPCVLLPYDIKVDEFAAYSRREVLRSSDLADSARLRDVLDRALAQPRGGLPIDAAVLWKRISLS